jgi:hypothetical protein
VEYTAASFPRALYDDYPRVHESFAWFATPFDVALAYSSVTSIGEVAWEPLVGCAAPAGGDLWPVVELDPEFHLPFVSYGMWPHRWQLINNSVPIIAEGLGDLNYFASCTSTRRHDLSYLASFASPGRLAYYDLWLRRRGTSLEELQAKLAGDDGGRARLRARRRRAEQRRLATILRRPRACRPYVRHPCVRHEQKQRHADDSGEIDAPSNLPNRFCRSTDQLSSARDYC